MAEKLICTQRKNDLSANLHYENAYIFKSTIMSLHIEFSINESTFDKLEYMSTTDRIPPATNICDFYI